MKISDKIARHAVGAVAQMFREAGQYVNAEMIGSLAIVGEGKDCDVLVFVNTLDGAKAAAFAKGFHLSGLEGVASGSADGWCSMVREGLNLILTDELSFYHAQIQSCRTLRFLHERGILPEGRDFRVALHQIGDTVHQELRMEF